MGNNTKGAQDSAKDGGSSNGLFFTVCGLIAAGILYRALHPLILRVQSFAVNHAALTCLTLGVFLLSAVSTVAAVWWNRHLENTEEDFVTVEDSESVLLGRDLDTDKDVHLKATFRTMHTQLIGTTNAGKTASVILPWAVNDIEQGRGCLIVDGKSDRGFLDKLYANVVQAGRQSDFLIFSLANPYISSTFNPFCHGTPEQITERVFSSFPFENEFYRGVQFSALRTVVALLMRRGQKPMPGVIRECLRSKETLQGWLEGLNDPTLTRDVLAIVEEKDEEFEKKYTGLTTALGSFSQGDAASLYNTRNPEIILSNVLRQQKICYFQLPTMQFPFLGTATGKLLLQSLQSTISELQVGGDRLKSLFSVYLDDFNDYIYPGFTSLLNKSRSANVGVVFAHQSLGDLEKVGPDFKQTVLTNTNIKIIMRSNDPESAEHFAKSIGTITEEKTTERRKRSILGQEDTGDQSVRETEAYVSHPNVIKTKLGMGQGLVVIPHALGRVVHHVQFRMAPDLPVFRLPLRDLPVVDLAAEATSPHAKKGKAKAPSRKKKREKQESGNTPAAAQQEVKIVKKGKKAALAATVTSALLVFALGAIGPGCATTGRSVGAGAAAGGIAGAGIGAIADPGRHGEMRFRNVVIGTAVGAAVGAGAGFAMDRFVHDERDDAAKHAKEEASREAETHAAASTGLEPRLIPARTEARWVPDQIRGSTFVPGHFEYVIVEGARWETGK